MPHIIRWFAILVASVNLGAKGRMVAQHGSHLARGGPAKYKAQRLKQREEASVRVAPAPFPAHIILKALVALPTSWKAQASKALFSNAGERPR